MDEELELHNLDQNLTLGEVLKENGVTFNEFEKYWVIANTELIGKGNNSKIFDIGNNKVLKISNSIEEYNAIVECFNVLQDSYNEWFLHFVTLPEVLCPINENVYEKNGDDYDEVNYKRYYYIYPKLINLSKLEENIFRIIIDWKDTLFNGFDEFYDFEMEQHDEVMEFFRIEFPNIYKNNQRLISDCILFSINLVEFKNEFNFYDFHIENIMKKSSGNYTLIDFQYG